MTASSTPTAARLPGRAVKQDSQGRKYVHIQQVKIGPAEKVAVRVTIVSNPNPASGRFAESTFDLLYLDGQPPTLKTKRHAIRQKGTALTVGEIRAASLRAACRIALGKTQPGDRVQTRAQRAAARPSPAARAASASTPPASGSASDPHGSAELNAQLAASLAATAADAQREQNERPSVRRETAKARRAREARERAAAASADAAATIAAIDAVTENNVGGRAAPATTTETPAPAAPASE